MNSYKNESSQPLTSFDEIWRAAMELPLDCWPVICLKVWTNRSKWKSTPPGRRKSNAVFVTLTKAESS